MSSSSCLPSIDVNSNLVRNIVRRCSPDNCVSISSDFLAEQLIPNQQNQPPFKTFVNINNVVKTWIVSFIWNFVALGLKFYADNFSSCLRRWGRGKSAAFHFSAERDCKQKHLSCSHGTETQTSLWWHEMPFNSAAGRKILGLTSTRGKKNWEKSHF